MLALIAFDKRFVSLFDLSYEFIFVVLADLRASHFALRSKFVKTCLHDGFVFGLEGFGREVRLVCTTQLKRRGMNKTTSTLSVAGLKVVRKRNGVKSTIFVKLHSNIPCTHTYMCM